ncbi:MAG: hypothetical protein AB2L24_34130 [Mangrovibacterium sp.]
MSVNGTTLCGKAISRDRRMLIHREFTNACPASLIIYNDRVETKNANRPHVYGQLTPETFQPFPKNPHLAQIFTQMGRSEELGTGLRNVYKFSKAYSGSDQIVFFEDDIFKATIPLSKSYADRVTKKVTKKVGEKLTENQSLILKNMINNPYITTGELVMVVKISQRKIKENIMKLKEKIEQFVIVIQITYRYKMTLINKDFRQKRRAYKNR